jgi:hypothetical protein
MHRCCKSCGAVATPSVLRHPDDGTTGARHLLVIVILLACVVLLGMFVLVDVNRWRYERRIARDVGSLLGTSPITARATVTSELPAVVERYRRIAVSECAPVRTLRLRHGGTFRMSPSSKPKPIRGEQWFTSDPPGFVWSARVRIAPGVWVRARDMIVDGKGGMRVLLEDIVTLADARGPQFDQGDALRLLAEMVWYPTALFDPRTVTWSEIDARHARATLQLKQLSVSAIFEFGADGLPLAMTAERFNDKGELRPWGGAYRDWRVVGGMRVPFEAEVSWQTSPPFVYAHWLVESMELDARGERSPSRWGAWAIALELVLGVGALIGGGALVVGPHGEILPLPVSALSGSPFASYFIPGMILFAILGVAPVVVAMLSLRRSSIAPLLALGVSSALVVWIAVEIAIVGYSNHPPLQLIYLVLGIVMTMVAAAWMATTRGTPLPESPAYRGT